MSEPRCAWSYFSEKHETGFASEKVALLLTMGYVGEAVALFKKKKKDTFLMSYGFQLDLFEGTVS